MPETPPTAERTVVIAPGSAARMARDYTKWFCTRPAMQVAFVVFAGILATAIALMLMTRDVGVLWLAFVTPFAVAGAIIGTYISTKRSIALSYPEGSTATLAVGESSLTSTTAVGGGTLSYAALRKAWHEDSVFVVMLRGSWATAVMPGELVTGEDLATIHRGIESTAPSR